MFRRIPTLLILAGFLVVVAASCSDDDEVTSAGPDRFDALIAEFELAPISAIPYPGNNPHTPARIALGKLLFFDPILGGESAPWVKSSAGKDPYRFRANDMACATCHHPTLGFADGRNLSAGVGGAQFNDLDLGPDRVAPAASIVTGDPLGIVPRNAPSCLNVGLNGKDSITPTAESFQFLDGRVDLGLDEQAKLPITSRDEMAGDAYGRPELGDLLTAAAIQDSVVNRIRGIPEYVERFKQAFAGEISVAGDITLDHVAMSIGAYERELITPNSRYDRFLMGDRNALNDVEKDGFELFFGKALCGDCHGGPMLADFKFHVQGAADDYEKFHPGFEGKSGDGRDLGRFHADNVEFADDKYAFRTLTVRNAELTGPYFHSGSAGTLHEVMAFYNRGGRGPDDLSDAELAGEGAVRDESIKALNLSEAEVDAIVAFMRSTTAAVQPGPSGMDLVSVPRRVPSGLLPPGIPTPPGKPGPYYPEPGDLP